MIVYCFTEIVKGLQPCFSFLDVLVGKISRKKMLVNVLAEGKTLRGLSVLGFNVINS